MGQSIPLGAVDSAPGPSCFALIGPYFNCSDPRGVTMPTFEKFYLAWNQWFGLDCGRFGG
jgi:hypothetical protein